MNDLYEKDGFGIAIPKDDVNLTNVLITHQFEFVKEAHYGCADTSIAVCSNEKEVFDALSEFYGNY